LIKELRKHKRFTVDFSDPEVQEHIDALRGDKTLFCNPEPVRGNEGSVHWVVQAYEQGGGYVLAWDSKQTGEKRELFAYTIDCFEQGTPKPDQAIQQVSEGLEERNLKRFTGDRFIKWRPPPVKMVLFWT
jgi:hypothetical protein